MVAAKAESPPKLDAVGDAREAAVEAEEMGVAAAEATREAARGLAPVSVFISRKTQRLYVRQAFQPVLESPITIQRPIVRSERMSSRRWSASVTATCDGAWCR
jgi:hypothetical protein